MARVNWWDTLPTTHICQHPYEQRYVLCDAVEKCGECGAVRFRGRGEVQPWQPAVRQIKRTALRYLTRPRDVAYARYMEFDERTLERVAAGIRRMDAQTLSARIRNARAKARSNEGNKLSHDQIVEWMGESSRQHLIKLENGTHRPRARTLLLYAGATGYPVDWFLASGPSPFPRRFSGRDD